MRKLRIALITIAGGAPALAATIFACGSDERDPFGPTAPSEDARTSDYRGFEPGPEPDAQPTSCCYVLELPDAGDAATPEQLCALQPSPAETLAARVTLGAFSSATKTYAGFVSMPPELEAVVVGVPTLSIDVTTITKVAGGFQFEAPLPEGSSWGASFAVSATFEITCADGGTKTVKSMTRLTYCDSADDGRQWFSSGDRCCDCEIIAEMAPSPIVSDKKKDDLPLARVVRLRVLEIARAGRQVLLFAESDAGSDLEIEWNVSGGTFERIAPDVILWTLPDEDASPFGQVAVLNDAGAAVENFVWGVA